MQKQMNQHQHAEEVFKKLKNKCHPWNREDAVNALKEEEVCMKGLKNNLLVIRFPEREVSKELVQSCNQAIDKVDFQISSGPKYCFVQLNDKANVDKTIEELEEVNFGYGKLHVEKKILKEEEDLEPETIDPYTLYVGNLPTNISAACLKETFPTASRIDIGYSPKMKNTWYALIQYNSVDEAIKCYRESHNLVIESRSIFVRFRRQGGHVGLPSENENQKQQPKSPKTKVEKEKDEEKKKEGKQENVQFKKELKNDDEDDKDDDEDDNDGDKDEDKGDEADGQEMSEI